MIKTVSSYPSADEKNTVSYKLWAPDEGQEVRAVVQLSHGMCEYVERYAAYAEHLTARGIVFAGNDHLGHGDTAASPDDYGFIADEGGADLLVRDVAQLSAILRAQYPDKKLILLGHSMGSFIARLYLTEFAENLDGVIIMGTGGKKPAGLGKFVASLVSSFGGNRKRSKLLQALCFAGNLKRTPKEEGVFAWLTKDREIVRAYEADERSGFNFTAAGYYDLFDLISRISGEEWAQKLPTDLPMLLVSGADDPIGGYGKGVGQVAALLSGIGVRDMTVKLFPGDRHEILNETDRADVYAYLDEWIDRVITPAEEYQYEHKEPADE